MIAFKFLARGSIAPFTGAPWPIPSHDGPGEWLNAPFGAGPENWIHACRPSDLPYWADAELWRIELSGQVRETPFQIQAERARIVDRIADWEKGISSAFILACAFRTRKFALDAFRECGLEGESRNLALASTLEELRHASSPLLRAPAIPARMKRLVGYCADAAISGRTGHAASVSHIAAMAAGAVRGNGADARDERAWQARWIAERLGLEAP